MSPSFDTRIDTARRLDSLDPLRSFRERFHFPLHNGAPVIYFCGNSLGLQPVATAKAFETELASWKDLAIGGYTRGAHPWLYYQQYAGPSLSRIMGASEQELTVMNALTVNLHLMLLSFYRPTPQRFRIIMEAGAFPSDQYAVETLVRHHHLDPAETIIEIAPRPGEKLIREEDIVKAIGDHAETLALVLFGGINYYSGQLFDMKKITGAAHSVGALAGFDLAHVAGNVPVSLHDWQVDFAVWCSYKYLNAGPGAVAGIFVHEKWASDIQTHRLAGWWGNDEKTRFRMEKGFVPKPNAGGWNISTAQVFNTVALNASLQLFDEAGMDVLRDKSRLLTAYLEFLLRQTSHLAFEIITPAEPDRRGAQLSLFFTEKGLDVYNKMIDNGIVVDYREPGVIRVAPAPLYCSFEDVFRFYQILLTVTA